MLECFKYNFSMSTDGIKYTHVNFEACKFATFFKTPDNCEFIWVTMAVLSHTSREVASYLCPYLLPILEPEKTHAWISMYKYCHLINAVWYIYLAIFIRNRYLDYWVNFHCVILQSIGIVDVCDLRYVEIFSV